MLKLLIGYRIAKCRTEIRTMDLNTIPCREIKMKNNKGFTLIELAVVLAIIAVLAAVLTPVVTGYLDQARLSRAQADVRTIADAIKLYHTDTGVYPFFDSVAA